MRAVPQLRRAGRLMRRYCGNLHKWTRICRSRTKPPCLSPDRDLPHGLLHPRERVVAERMSAHQTKECLLIMQQQLDGQRPSWDWPGSLR